MNAKSKKIIFKRTHLYGSFETLMASQCPFDSVLQNV